MDFVRKFGFRLDKAGSGADDLPTFILSDETVDSVGDVIQAKGWDLSRFRGPNANPIALFNHNSNEPIGVWESVKVDGTRLIGALRLAAEGTSETVDKVRKLFAQGMLVAVSVGFRPSKWEPIPDSKEGGYLYQKQQLLECSVVSVPANPSAVLIRSFNPGLRVEEAEQLLAEAVRQKLVPVSGVRRPAPIVGKTAATGRPTVIGRSQTMKTLAEQIQALQDEVIALQDRNAPLHEKQSEGIDLTDDEGTEFDETLLLIETAEKKLARLRATEKAKGLAASQRQTERPVIQTPGVVTDPTVMRRQLGERPRDLLVRMAVINFRSFALRQPLDQIRQSYYPERAELDAVVKAVTNPAMTTVAGWAAELVDSAIADFLESLRPVSAYGALRGLGAQFTFGRNGSIKIPSRNHVRRGPGDLAGAFVGEGQPIPVRRGSTGSITLIPHKMGVISTYTREMAMHSTPAIESIIREGIVEDTAVAIDAALLDNNPATAIRPAGLLNGVVAIPGTAGGGVDAMTDDIAAALGPFITANAASGLAWLMNPANAFKLTWAATPVGTYPFRENVAAGNLAGYPIIQSTNVPVDRILLVRASDFATSSGDTPTFDVSDQATIHEDDGSYPATEAIPVPGSVLPIATGAAGAGVVATPVRSLWQTASIGIRMLLDIDWAMRRPGMVVEISPITW